MDITEWQIALSAHAIILFGSQWISFLFDIMHGQLKIDMLEAEAAYNEAVKIEEDNDYSDAMESMDRKYAEGFMDAISYMYKMTYDISFAIAAKEAGE